MNSKKRLSLALAIVLVAALIVGATLAFLTSSDEVTNTFTLGDVEIEIEEPGWDPEDGEDLLPGDTFVKDPTVTAKTGSANSYMRVTVTLYDTDAEKVDGEYPVITDAGRAAKILETLWYDPLMGKTGATIIPPTQYSETQTGLFPSTVTSWFNDVEFVIDASRSSTGVYVLNYIGNSCIFVADASATVFTHVIIPSNWDRPDFAIIGNYNIGLFAEAIQAKGFEADEAPGTRTAQQVAFDALDAQNAEV
jgi:predicted ribosomally synthesized peptide with SipW-like signal peptide